MFGACVDSSGVVGVGRVSGSRLGHICLLQVQQGLSQVRVAMEDVLGLGAGLGGAECRGLAWLVL